jgi:hypothetical protein
VGRIRIKREGGEEEKKRFFDIFKGGYADEKSKIVYFFARIRSVFSNDSSHPFCR